VGARRRRQPAAGAEGPAAARARRLWPALGRRRHAAAALALAVLIVAAYGNGISGGFTFDGRHLILDDPRVHAATRENLALIFTQDYWWPKAVSGLYRPVVKLSFLVDWALVGNADRPTGYHVTNLVLHWGNAVAVFLLGLVTMQRAAPSFAAAALFATHPIGTEAVTNLAGRADLLAALAVLSGTLLYARSRLGGRTVGWLVGLALVTALGALAKESAAALLAVIVLYELSYAEPAPTWTAAAMRLVRRSGPAVVFVLFPLVAVAGLRVWLYMGLTTPLLPFTDNPQVGADAVSARLTAIGVIGRYLWLLLWPQTLSCDYSYAQIPVIDLGRAGFPEWQVLGVVAGAAAVITLAVRRRRASPALFFWVGFFFVTLLPSANLVRVIGSIMAERFVYLPSAGFAASVALTAFALSGNRVRVAAAGLSLIVAAYTVRTAVRNRDWQDDLRLWSAAILASPRSLKAHQQLAYALFTADAPDHRHIDASVREGETALALMDAVPLPLTWRTSGVPAQLGAFYWVKGTKLDGPDGERRRWFERAVEVLDAAAAIDAAKNEEHRARETARGAAGPVTDIGNPEIYYYLGLAHLDLGRPAEALEALARMRRLAPANANAYWTTARAELAAGALDAAAISLRQVLILRPDDREAWRTLADLYPRLEGGGCAVIREGGGARLDPGCPRVRQDACAAIGGLAAAYGRAGQPALARQLEDAGRQRWGCP
jgi:tetratricopeptide (TPR) repeat protein